MKRKNVLAFTIATVMTSMITIPLSQASDIEIYQEAKSGDITLMFMIDLSGSMGSGDSGVTGTRFERVETAMRDLLQGNTAKGIEKLDDDKIIGLSTFDASTGHIRIPARKLGADVNGKKHRQILLDFATNLPKRNYRTPTANSYADVGAYMMGTTTKGISQSGFSNGSTSGDNKVRDNNKYIQPDSLNQSEELKQCSGQGIYVLTDGEPNESSQKIAGNLMNSALGVNTFNCNSSLLPDVNNPSYGTDGAWSCIGNFSQRLLDPTKNPAKIKIRTAVVGFGSIFNGLPSYNKALTQEQNLQNINNAVINSTIASDIKNAARWGIYGEGGWYSGNKSEDIVNSVNEFITSLATDIPSVTTGTPTVPTDALNSTIIQNYAYYPQFQPTPEKTNQSWLGNIKKYNIKNNGLVDSKSAKIVDNKGKLVPNYDLWAYTVSTDPGIKNADETTPGSDKFALIGGARSQLLLRGALTSTKEVERKLFTNRIVETGGTSKASTTLTPVQLDYLTKDGYKLDPDRGYLMNLLGYKVDPVASTTNTLTLDSVRKASELRQIGSVMHSSPILITNEGTITYDENTGKTSSKDRKDYVLFGTTQGLLHVLDAKTGAEKFAFVPHEMITKQKAAFNVPESSTGGMKSLYYGIDAPWIAYTEYVIADKTNSDKLKVGKGLNNLEGKQQVYGGLRMGGKSYYAIDLKDIDQPKMIFHIDPENQKIYNSSSTSGKNVPELANMGQSWSKPSIAWVRWNGERKRVMFVGGGYDAEGLNSTKSNQKASDTYRGYEYDNYAQTNQIGGGVYMFDAENGDLLWWSGSKATTTTTGNATGVVGYNDPNLKYSVVSEIKTVDRNSDGLIDHLYFGDLGGQVFRIDLNNELGKDKKNEFTKRVVRVLNLNSGDSSPRFYEMPAFTVYDYQGQPFGVVSIGSGNRSKPLAEYTSGATSYKEDAIYNVYDKDVVRKDLFNAGTIALSTPDRASNTNHLKEITDANRFSQDPEVAPYSESGWYYQFKSQKVQSEKVLNTPIVIKSDMYVSTFDASKPGLSGDCGAGVKGESFTTLFCMPYGQCKGGTKEAYRLSVGVGITAATIGGSTAEGDTRVIVANVDSAGSTGGSAILDKEYKAKNSLVVQRWYEKLEQPKTAS